MPTYAEKTFYENKSNPNKENSRDVISRISTHLYLGNEYQSFTESILLTHNIKAILCLNTYKKQFITIEKYKRMGISHLHVNISDESKADMGAYLENIYQFIDIALKENKKVFVHCQRGVSRSATAIIYYLMRVMFETGDYIHIDKTGCILNHIIQFVKSKRPIVEPNDGFILMLKNQEVDFIKKYVN